MERARTGLIWTIIIFTGLLPLTALLQVLLHQPPDSLWWGLAVACLSMGLIVAGALSIINHLITTRHPEYGIWLLGGSGIILGLQGWSGRIGAILGTALLSCVIVIPFVWEAFSLWRAQRTAGKLSRE